MLYLGYKKRRCVRTLREEKLLAAVTEEQKKKGKKRNGTFTVARVMSAYRAHVEKK